MLVKMIITQKGRNLSTDLHVSTFNKGEVYDLSDELAKVFLDNEFAISMEAKSSNVVLEDKKLKIEEDKAVEIEDDKYLQYTESDLDHLLKTKNMTELKNIAEYAGVSTKKYPRLKNFVKALKRQLNKKRGELV